MVDEVVDVIDYFLYVVAVLVEDVVPVVGAGRGRNARGRS